MASPPPFSISMLERTVLRSAVEAPALLSTFWTVFNSSGVMGGEGKGQTTDDRPPGGQIIILKIMTVDDNLVVAKWTKMVKARTPLGCKQKLKCRVST